MTKKLGNPNWGKPDVSASSFTGPSSFEEVCQEIAIVPGGLRAFRSTQGLGEKEQGSKVRAFGFVEGVGFRSSRRFVKARERIAPS